MRVTIILPVYNQERYLEAALSDALGQTYEDIEVIAVNDGSTDSSGLILKEISSADNRLKVIEKSNGGIVSANSTGIRAASGEYICFLDPDDRVEPDFVSSFVKELDRPYDFIAKGFQTESAGRSTPFSLKEDRVFTAGELRALSNHYLLTPSLAMGDSIYVTRWNKMYRRAVLLGFVDEYATCGKISLCEDVVFAYLLLQHAENGKSCSGPGSYHYYVHDVSMSHYFDYDRTVNELDVTFDRFKTIINRYTRDLTPALLSYYVGLAGQLGMAIGKGDSSARFIYSELQNNKRFRESVACAAEYSRVALSVEVIKAQLLYRKAPFLLYRFARNAYKLSKRWPKSSGVAGLLHGRVG